MCTPCAVVRQKRDIRLAHDVTAAAVLVPKTAVVTRSERTLVFTLDTVSRRAQWKYVTVSAENDEWVAIEEGIEAGELVIAKGNLTLDHDTPGLENVKK